MAEETNCDSFLHKYREVFDLMVEAARDDRLVLMHCKTRTAHKDVAVLGIMRRTPDGDVALAPVATVYDPTHDPDKSLLDPMASLHLDEGRPHDG